MSNKTMNNKGYIAPITMMSIFFICLLFFGIFFMRTTSVAVDMKDASKVVDIMNANNTGIERTQALLSKNPSYEGVVDYKDIGKKYSFSTINENLTPTILTSKSTPLKFNVSNATPITVALTVYPINATMSHSYNAELLYNGQNILTNSKNLTYDFKQIVSSDKVYDKKTQIAKYGEYMLNVTDMKNCYVELKVDYNVLKSRELLLKGDDIERNIVITNNGKLTVKFKEGGS